MDVESYISDLNNIKYLIDYGVGRKFSSFFDDDEILSDIYYVVLISAPKYNVDIASKNTYFAQCVRNYFIRKCKYNIRRKKMFKSLNLKNHNPALPDPSRFARLQIDLESTIAKMQGDLRSVANLLVRERLRASEIADKIGRSESTAKRLVSEVRNRILGLID